MGWVAGWEAGEGVLWQMNGVRKCNTTEWPEQPRAGAGFKQLTVLNVQEFCKLVVKHSYH